MRLSLGRMAVLACAFCCIAMPVQSVWAQTDKAEKPTEKAASTEKPAEKSALPPLPPAAHTQQSMELDGKTLHYTVDCGCAAGAR